MLLWSSLRSTAAATMSDVINQYGQTGAKRPRWGKTPTRRRKRRAAPPIIPAPRAVAHRSGHGPYVAEATSRTDLTGPIFFTMLQEANTSQLDDERFLSYGFLFHSSP